MSEEEQYPSEIMQCQNCEFYGNGFCTREKEGDKINPDVVCGNGLFEPIQVKKRLRECYDKISNVIDFYMEMPEQTKNIVILWIMGTYFHNHFNAYPYLFINAMRGSGKTRLLKIITSLAEKGQLLNSLTEAVIFRTVGTLAIDEFEHIGSKDKNALRELLNSSYKKGTKVFRMKKKKSIDGEEQVVEEFEPYRPIVMANIWGMEEVLGDRCISVNLERSNFEAKTKLVENFSEVEDINYTKNLLNSLVRCSLCSVVSSKNIYINWNDYIKHKYTPNTLYTLYTYNYTNYTKDYTQLFRKIDETEIEGRHLELFFPLFLIAGDIEGDEVLENTIKFAQSLVNDKKIEEITESKDVLVYSLIAKESQNEWKSVKELTNIFRLIIGDESEWINAHWLGRALKRLNLIKAKRRVGEGIQVMLDVEKAKMKEQIFKPKEK